MLSKLRTFLSPTRRKARRDIESLFGQYVSPELVERMIDAGESPTKVPLRREKVRVITFFFPGWGFSDASLPKLSALLEKMGNAPVDVSHSGLTICLSGEEKEEEFARVRALLESAAKEPEFDGFKIGVAEGFSEGFADIGRITTVAFQNAEKA